MTLVPPSHLRSSNQGIAEPSAVAEVEIEVCSAAPLRLMKIGDLIHVRGHAYFLRGLEPMSVDVRRIDLEDSATGERAWVELAEVEEKAEPAES